jgi:hypothetical protein
MSPRCVARAPRARRRRARTPSLTAPPSLPAPRSLPHHLSPRQRLEAQKEAALSLASALLQARVENSVGLLGMSGGGCRLLCSPVSGGMDGDALPKLSACLHGLKPQGGGGDVVCALRTAQLAFKYAKASEAGAAPQRRAVLFVGSPVGASREQLERLGKELKKVNVRGLQGGGRERRRLGGGGGGCFLAARCLSPRVAHHLSRPPAAPSLTPRAGGR